MNRTPVTTSIAVANYFIEKARKAGGITGIRLNILVYFAHGWYLGCNDRPLINECIQAVSSGPLVRAIYDATRGWGNALIWDPLDDPYSNTYTREKPGVTDPFIKKFLDGTWRTCADFSSITLELAVTKPGTPWDWLARKHNYTISKPIEIPYEMLREYFFEPNSIEIKIRSSKWKQIKTTWYRLMENWKLRPRRLKGHPGRD